MYFSVAREVLCLARVIVSFPFGLFRSIFSLVGYSIFSFVSFSVPSLNVKYVVSLPLVCSVGSDSMQKMLRNMIWRLYTVLAWSVPVLWDKILCSFVCPHMPGYRLHCKISIYVCTIFAGFVFVDEVPWVWHDVILFGSENTFGVVWGWFHFVHGYCIVYSVPVFLTLYGVTDMALNGLKVFDSDFVRGAFALRSDSFICATGLSTKKV